MTWNEIDAALERHPATFGNTQARAPVFAAIDGQITDRYTEHRPDLVAMYRRRIDRALDRMESGTVTGGVRLWKFYSCSVVLQSSDGFVAVDFCEGPAAGDEVPERGEVAALDFYWRPDQRARLADLVDVSLITHANRDHFDVGLSEMLAERGKTIVAPQRLKDSWTPRGLGRHVSVPEYDTVQQVGPCEILTYDGVQFGGPYEPGTWRTPYKRREDDCPTVVYLIRMGGVVFLHCAENYERIDGWLARCTERGWEADVLFQPGMGWCPASVAAACPHVFDFRVHDLEMTHTGGGSKISVLFHDWDGFRRRRRMYCMWGEDFLVNRELLAPLRCARHGGREAD